MDPEGACKLAQHEISGVFQGTRGTAWVATLKRADPGRPRENICALSAQISEMPRNARVVAPGLPYHITQRGTNRQRVFLTVADRSLYLRLVRENQAEAGVRILAYCLMRNHVHFVAVPQREDSLAVLFGRANGRYAAGTCGRRGFTRARSRIRTCWGYGTGAACWTWGSGSGPAARQPGRSF